MTCKTIDTPDGFAIVCTRGRGTCQFCKSAGTLLCDGPGKASGRTCDAKICKAHSTKFMVNGKKLDYCPNCTKRARGEK